MLLTSSNAANFEKINHDLRFPIGCFHEVLADLGEEDLARCPPRTDTETRLASEWAHSAAPLLRQFTGVSLVSVCVNGYVDKPGAHKE